MIRVAVLGASVLGPGLPGWVESVPVLAGRQDWIRADTNLPPPARLPANERRRAGAPVRIAMAASGDAAAMAGAPPCSLRSVFASSNGDGAVLHAILQALSIPDGQVSPTQFHNSVHNAVAAYWTIGIGSTRPATCIGMHDDTYAAGLLKAASEASAEREPTLLCTYDAPMPGPLNAKRPTAFAFGTALVLGPEDGVVGARSPLAHLTLNYFAAPCEPGAWLPLAPGLREMAMGNAAARGLRLLEALARDRADTFALPLAGGRVEIAVAR